MWPFKSKLVGQPVSINCGKQSAEFRRDRASTRLFNLIAKLGRLHSRESMPGIPQEIANTRVAIRDWGNVLELAELELEQQNRRGSIL